MWSHRTLMYQKGNWGRIMAKNYEDKIRSTMLQNEGGRLPLRQGLEQSIQPSFGAQEEDDEEQGEKLIPGIPDDVTLNHVLAKLDWEKLLSLASVSRAWHRVINQRELHKARLRNGATQNYLAIVHKAPRSFKTGRLSRELSTTEFISRFYDDKDVVPQQFHLAISLYNPSANSWQLLPPIPQVNCGIPHLASCVFLSGKLYILGGEGRRNMRCTPRNTVFVLDLAVGLARRVWQECASMQFGRSDFACGAIDGKIYVAGGWSHRDHVWVEGEVFYPEKNSWERIADMPTARLNYTVGILDKQLYVIGGSIFYSVGDPEYYEAHRLELEANWADVYDPRKNEWSRIDKIGNDQKAQTWVVTADEKLYSVRSDSISMYEKRSESWTSIMANSWELLESKGAMFCSACAAVHVDGEVFAFVRWLKGWPYELTLLRAKDVITGAGVQNGKLPAPEWESVNSPHGFNRDFFFLVPVQL
ncbi:unnamed protein product [Calypogeia fissa]